MKFQRRERPDQKYMGMAIALGTGIGVAIGTAMGNIAIGIAIGISIGVAAGASLDARKKNQKEDDLGLFYNFSTMIQKGMFYTSSVTKRSFITEKDIEDVMNSIIEDINVEDTKIPFAVVSISLHILT